MAAAAPRGTPHWARGERGGCGEGGAMVIDLTEEGCDKIDGGQVRFLSWHGLHTPYQLGGTA